MTQAAANTFPDDLRADWDKFRDLGELVYRNGFDAGKVLGKAEHEIRGMDCHCLGGTRYLVVAGDKLGQWYAATFDTTDTDTEDFDWRPLPPIPTDGGLYRVIDRLLFVPCRQGDGVVIGTRGNGAWLVPLERLLDASWDDPDDILLLPGSEGRSIRHLLFDDFASSPTLFGVAGKEIFHWSLSEGLPHLRRHERDLDFQITALTIDYDEDRTKRQARHLDGIVDAILSLGDRDIEVNLDDVHLGALVYDVVRTVRREAKARGIQISFLPYHLDEKKEKTEKIFKTDEAKLYDILLNLIVNTVKYSPEEGEVHVRADMTAKGAEVAVRDHGPGIPENEQDLLYEPFFRGAYPKVRGIPGLRLGLYVARLYANALGARIQLTSSGRALSFFSFYHFFVEHSKTEPTNA